MAKIASESLFELGDVVALRGFAADALCPRPDLERLEQAGQAVGGERLAGLPFRPRPALHGDKGVDQLARGDAVDTALGEDYADVGKQLYPDRVILHRRLDRG